MSKILRIFFLVLVTGGFSSFSNATVYSTSASTIARVDTYTQYGEGDVIITLANNSLAASCPYGFWIRGTDRGAKTTFAQVLAARHTDSAIVIHADTSITWSGSQFAACLVWTIETL